MKKQLLNLGKGLNKIEQKEINGGGGGHAFCGVFSDCPAGQGCCKGLCLGNDHPNWNRPGFCEGS